MTPRAAGWGRGSGRPCSLPRGCAGRSSLKGSVPFSVVPQRRASTSTACLGTEHHPQHLHPSPQASPLALEGDGGAIPKTRCRPAQGRRARREEKAFLLTLSKASTSKKKKNTTAKTHSQVKMLSRLQWERTTRASHQPRPLPGPLNPCVSGWSPPSTLRKGW